MSELEKIRAILTARNAFYASLAAASMLAGCVATVRVPPPPPPPAVYVPPPPPAPAVEVESAPVSVQMQASEAPPPLPEYEQPPCPEPGFLWTPGYWAFSTGGYYWVPGTWVAPPAVGLLWTPGYWRVGGGEYMFHAGYWGPHVGFYGGVNYGFGYGGAGFVGGRWNGGAFAYNTAVVHVNTTVIHNTYVNNTVINNTTVNRVSFNGGAGGVAARPTPAERAVMTEPHTPATTLQNQHVHEALRNPQLSAKSNGGHPAIAATARPAAFSGPGVVGARGAPPLKPAAPAHAMPVSAAAHPMQTQPPHAQTAAPKAPVAGNAGVHTPPPPATHAAKAPPPKPAPKKSTEKNEKP